MKHPNKKIEKHSQNRAELAAAIHHGRRNYLASMGAFVEAMIQKSVKELK